ncbi:MAG: YraN family protein [Gammaproteobacteria bacterium]|nr:YraN family protein [Gammaproteobacteria bacterium]
MAEHLESGRGAERLARTRLERGGLSWIASNYRCRLGELDLVMSDDATLVVVEVRYRRSTRLMNPCESLTAPKLRRVALATRHFVQRHHRWREAPVRFDVVGIHGPLNDARMNWIRGAFTIDNL